MLESQKRVSKANAQLVAREHHQQVARMCSQLGNANERLMLLSTFRSLCTSITNALLLKVGVCLTKIFIASLAFKSL